MQSEAVHEPGLDVLREAFLNALLAPDGRRARTLLLGAADAGVPVARLYCDVLQPAMYEVGERWQRAHISVAQEHLATQLTQAALAQLALRLTGDGHTGTGRTAIVSCSPGELHSIGGQMVSDFLEADGWEVLTLGADVPPEDVAAMAAEHGADLVAISTALPAHLLSAGLTCGAVRRLHPRPLIVAGGQAYEADRERAAAVGADHFAADPEELLQILASHFSADGHPAG